MPPLLRLAEIMTGTPVAGNGDVTAKPGSVPFTGADSGTWTADAVTVTTYPKLRANGVPVAFTASCTFLFAGTKGTASVTGSEVVTLTAAGSAKLLQGQHGVLLDGDSVESSFGNTLTASSTRTLRTS